MSSYKTIEEIEREIVEEFSLFDSWDDKYEYIIDLGKKLPLLDDKYKIDENRVRGCQSTVYLVADFKDARPDEPQEKDSEGKPVGRGKVLYKAESDAVIVKGLISMLIRVLSGQKPDDIVNAPLNFIKEIGMMTHLAQTRSNGLLAMVKQMKNYALAYKVKDSIGSLNN
jgi:cysteine desulfuration protein SufE